MSESVLSPWYLLVEPDGLQPQSGLQDVSQRFGAMARRLAADDVVADRLRIGVMALDEHATVLLPLTDVIGLNGFAVRDGLIAAGTLRCCLESAVSAIRSNLAQLLADGFAVDQVGVCVLARGAPSRFGSEGPLREELSRLAAEDFSLFVGGPLTDSATMMWTAKSIGASCRHGVAQAARPVPPYGNVPVDSN